MGSQEPGALGVFGRQRWGMCEGAKGLEGKTGLERAIECSGSPHGLARSDPAEWWGWDPGHSACWSGGSRL